MGPASIVLVVGAPGAGKTTLTGPLAAALEATSLSLDGIKETLYARGEHSDDRFALRLAAERELIRLVRDSPEGCVVDIWVCPGRDEERTRSWVSRLGRPVVEVLCRVSPEVAVRRYAARGRPPPHLPTDETILRRIRDAAPLITPLGLGPCVEVDTSAAVDVDRVARAVRTCLTNARGPLT